MSLEQFKQIKTSREEIVTPEMLEDLKARYEQGGAVFRQENQKYLKRADKILDEKTRALVFARYGLKSVELANIEREVMLSMN